MKPAKLRNGWQGPAVSVARICVLVAVVVGAALVLKNALVCHPKTQLLANLHQAPPCPVCRPNVPPSLPDPPAIVESVPCPPAASQQSGAVKESCRPELQQAQQELAHLTTKLKRNEELLRIRNEQLVEAHGIVEDREAVWRNATRRRDGKEPPTLLVALAIISEYDAVWQRNLCRKAWYSNGSAESLVEAEGVKVVFILGKNPTAPPGTAVAADSAEVEREAATYNDLIRLPVQHAEQGEMRSRLTKELWRKLPAQVDALYYVRAQINALPNPHVIASVLKQRMDPGPSYVGCMKSGPVVSDSSAAWYEPQAWKFGSAQAGDGKPVSHYPLHAAASGYAISRDLALHFSANADLLMVFSNEDVMMGTWLLGLDVQHVSEPQFCCGDPQRCSDSRSSSSLQHDHTNRACALHNGGCNGICSIDTPETFRAYLPCIAEGSDRAESIVGLGH